MQSAGWPRLPATYTLTKEGEYFRQAGRAVDSAVLATATNSCFIAMISTVVRSDIRVYASGKFKGPENGNGVLLSFFCAARYFRYLGVRRGMHTITPVLATEKTQIQEWPCHEAATVHVDTFRSTYLIFIPC